MAKDYTIAYLLDLYGAALTEKQRILMECYYNDDLSLSEISENEGITRQGARDGIKRAESQLKDWEARLGLLKKARLQNKTAGDICAAARQAADLAAAGAENLAICRYMQDICELAEQLMTELPAES